MYQERTYRQSHSPDLTGFQIQYEACDLWIAISPSTYTDSLPQQCLHFIRQLWQELYTYIDTDTEFARTLSPYTPADSAPHSAEQMAIASRQAGVGPMAAVAGYFAQALGEYLIELMSPADLIIENGGDIWLRSSQSRTIALHAGQSPFSGKIALDIPATKSLSICTSSGTVGHSLSFGRADAVTVLATDASLADAFATAIANRILDPSDITRELNELPTVILGCVIILGEHIGAKGAIKIVALTN